MSSFQVDPAFRQEFTGDVLLPGDDGYDDSLRRWSELCVQPAAVVFKPKSAADLSLTIRLAARHPDLPVAVCGGGHSTSGGNSCTGIVIHLEHLNSVSVDPDRRTVDFAGGCSWDQIYDAAWEHDLVAVGGTVGHTGAAGLVLHGGFGWLSGRHGLALDCLLEMEAVLANGEIVVASETENPDLFWALRGAGASFAAVTRFRMQLFPGPERVWFGEVVFPWPRAREVLTWASERIAPLLTADLGVAIMAILGAEPAIVAICFFAGPEKEARATELFKSLFALGPVADNTFECAYPEANPSGPTARFSNGQRRLFGGATFTVPLDVDAILRDADAWSAFMTRSEKGEAGGGAQQQNSSGGAHAMIALEFLSQAKIAEVPVHATACGARSGQFNVGTISQWTDPARDDEIKAYSRNFSRRVREGSWNGGVSGNRVDTANQYVNYMSEGATAEESFGVNAVRLKELKTRFDPTNMFKKPWGLGSK